MSYVKATEQDPLKMSDTQLSQFIKYQYQRTAHQYERMDYAIRITMRGETPDDPIRSLRKKYVLQLDLLQVALDEQQRRQTSMR